MINSTINIEKKAEVLWRRRYRLISHDEKLIESVNTTENMENIKNKQDFGPNLEIIRMN